MASPGPLAARGLLNASRRFIVSGVIPLGSLVGGAIGECFAFLPVLLSPIRSLRAMPEPEELPASTAPFATPTDA